jgi:hypothetical protein
MLLLIGFIRGKLYKGYLIFIKTTASAYTSIAIILFLLLLHAPYSIKYHAEYDLYNHKKDIISIYIAHIIMHIALSYNLPWTIKIITLNILKK